MHRGTGAVDRCLMTIWPTPGRKFSQPTCLYVHCFPTLNGADMFLKNSLSVLTGNLTWLFEIWIQAWLSSIEFIDIKWLTAPTTETISVREVKWTDSSGSSEEPLINKTWRRKSDTSQPNCYLTGYKNSKPIFFFMSVHSVTRVQ